jgi:hypothetical protein
LGALTETHVVVFAFAGRADRVLVKVGSGLYRTFAHDGIMVMDSMGLLKALKNDEGFSASLKDVALNACRLFVSPTAQHELTEAERRATELLYDNTIGSLAGTASRVFIRVDVPAAGGGGECRRVTACGLTPPPRHALTDESLRGV